MRYPLPCLLISLLITSCAEEPKTLFTMVPSDRSGITFNNQIVETDSFNILTSEYIFNGGGVAVGDFNNDDRPDLFFTGNQVSNQLYLNQGDLKFEDVSKIADIEANEVWTTGVALVDINSDGLLDIYTCTAMLEGENKKANQLFVNQGINEDGIPKFKEMANAFGIDDPANSMGAAFFDYNNDGLLDLYVLNNIDIHELPTNYREKITDGSAESNDRLYRNNGNNSFTDVTLEAGITIEGFGLGVAAADLNYDGYTDLYISNDYLTNDLLYINNRDGTFSNEIDGQIKHQSKFSMGSDISDFNNDGHLDIVTLDMLGETNLRLKTTLGTNKYTNYIFNDKYDYEYQYSRNMLQLGNGVGVPYSEVGLMAGVGRTDWSWSPLFVDADNDGLKDLLITNGFPRDITDMDFGDFNFNVRRYLSPAQILDSIPIVKIPNYAFRNKGEVDFEDVGDAWGLSVPSFSNGAAFADLDADGDMDYIVNNINEKAFLFENHLDEREDKNHNFIQIALDGKRNNTAGIGAKLVIRFTDGSFQYHEQQLHRGYMSTVQNKVQFGLADRKEIGSLEILWPDGKYQKLDKVKSNQMLTLSYKDASDIESGNMTFPLVAQESSTIFKEVSKQVGIDYTHQEEDIVDYNVQRILPHKLTQNGPCLVAGDINGDGFEDFIVGSSAGFSPEIFLQDKDGTFERRPLFEKSEQNRFEEEAMALFDLENDGDLDLYLVSGSNEYQKNNNLYSDRLLLNNGDGQFTEANDKLPEISASGSTVKATDFDNDGYVDLFIGGRTPFAQYPTPDKSYLLKNKEGNLTDLTDTLAPELRDIGMVTDAAWADIDGDGSEDLIVVGELMPLTVFKNERSSFEKLENTALDSLKGWWECVIAEDFDRDGDMDLVAGNLGRNNFYQPSEERPVHLYAKDFDKNGTVDPVMFAYFKDDFDNAEYQSFPVNFWGDLYAQSPLFRSKFNYYKEYARATRETLFEPEELEGTIELIGNYDRTTYFENLGSGKFKKRELPWNVQTAPINRIAVTDYNDDDHLDMLLIGNDFGNEIFIGRYDALNGNLLQGNGKNGFKDVRAAQSGFVVDGDAKDMVVVENASNANPYIIVTQNRGDIKVFQKKIN